MTPDDIYVAVKAIEYLARDDESAHSHEDELHQRVLQAIAEGRCADPAACARAALATQEIDFARWCA